MSDKSGSAAAAGPAASGSGKKHKPSRTREKRKEHARRVLQEQEARRARRAFQRPSEFLCKLRFRNNLPPLPFDPKLLRFEFDADRLSRYSATKLEVDLKPELHTEADMGVSVDLVDPDAYTVPAERQELHPDDAELLKRAPKRKRDSGGVVKSKRTSNRVAWLRKGEYLSNDLYDPVIKHRSDVEERNAARMRLMEETKAAEEAELPPLQHALASFEAMQSPPVHKTKPELKAEVVLPVLPDLTRWGTGYQQVVFDARPRTDSSAKPKVGDQPRLLRSRALVRSSKVRVDGHLFCQYLVPAAATVDAEAKAAAAAAAAAEASGGDATLEAAKVEEDTLFSYVRDFRLTIRSVRGDDTAEAEHFVWMVDEDAGAVFYDELQARMELRKSKRRKLAHEADRRPHDELITEESGLLLVREEAADDEDAAGGGGPSSASASAAAAAAAAVEDDGSGLLM